MSLRGATRERRCDESLSKAADMPFVLGSDQWVLKL